MASHTVTITVDNGKLSYTDDPLGVGPDDKVRWYCDETFAIIFPVGGSPFYPDKAVVAARGGNNTRYMDIRNPGTFPKPYKYMVVVFDGNDLIVNDPIIIIDDDGGGGPRGGSKRRPKKK
jgi:hypothetical protein